ncbi:MAG: NAD-dependent epimerase/dehydratase family protein [Deltaproteobacteria bacterium]|nr:NAD-dependent epimerase/dehydratase family protein [Deltaproteobacteria bacterium]
MNCLVTGGAGFIGSHLADALLAAGHAVTVLDNLSTGRRNQVNAEARFIEMDLQDSGVTKVFADGAFEAVFHLAAQTDVMTSIASPAEDAHTNIVGGIRLLDKCRQFGVSKVIYSSSSAVFGDPAYLPMDEAHAIAPLCPYAVSKHTLEHYLEIFWQLHGLKYTVLRYANAYGPRQDPHHEGGVVAIFGYKLLKGIRPTIYGDGKQTRDFVYVTDLVAANLACLRTGDNECFNLGTGEETSVNQLFEMLAAVCGSDIEPRYEQERKGEMRRLSLMSVKARDNLGWVPRTSLRDGIQQVVNHFREHLDGKL